MSTQLCWKQFSKNCLTCVDQKMDHKTWKEEVKLCIVFTPGKLSAGCHIDSRAHSLGSAGSHCGHGAPAGLQLLRFLRDLPSAPQKPGPSDNGHHLPIFSLQDTPIVEDGGLKTLSIRGSHPTLMGANLFLLPTLCVHLYFWCFWCQAPASSTPRPCKSDPKIR